MLTFFASGPLEGFDPFEALPQDEDRAASSDEALPQHAGGAAAAAGVKDALRTSRAAALHRVQLISGSVVSTEPLPLLPALLRRSKPHHPATRSATGEAGAHGSGGAVAASTPPSLYAPLRRLVSRASVSNLTAGSASGSRRHERGSLLSPPTPVTR